MTPARNIELKARISDLPAAREIALLVATESLGVQQQTDIYFHCPQGRMKLREIVEIEPPPRIVASVTRTAGRDRGETATRAQLIWYDRTDAPSARESDYQITEVLDPERIRELKAQMGIHVVVSKRREIFLFHNVRIHLDEVAQLGTFIEFEAVLGRGANESAGQAQLAALRDQFHILPRDLLSTSYADLLAERTKSSRLAGNSDQSAAAVPTVSALPPV